MIKAPCKEKPRVAFVATARYAEKAVINAASTILEKHGCSIVSSPNLYAKENQFGGSDEERFTNFKWAWENPNVDVIWIIRGGYGSVRICDKISDLIQQSSLKKWLVGYSDVTAIHSVLAKSGLCSVHGTMPVNFEKNTEESICRVLEILRTGKGQGMEFASHAFNQLGKASGKLIGGNLSMLYSLQGTAFQSDYNDTILFFEDLDEYLYHIDRIMQNFKHGGILSKIKGMLIGQLSDMHDNSIPFGKNAEEIVNSYSHLLGIPIAFNAPFGHCENNLPLIHGATACLEVNAKQTHLSYVDRKG